MMKNSSAENVLGEGIAQLSRTGLPFNPLGVMDEKGINITGGNVARVQQSMKMFGWSDPRFVTEEQAAFNGWEIGEEAIGVEVSRRDEMTGRIENNIMFNAQNVIGMPSLSEMLQMTDSEIMKMRGQNVAEEEFDELVIGPAQEPAIDVTAEIIADQQPLTAPVADGLSAEISGGVDEVGEALDKADDGPKKLMVMAPYWLNGLHNKEGIDLAIRLNQLIAANKLIEDEEAIERLLEGQAKARRLGLEMVPESVFLANEDHKMNRAEPRRLLGGQLVRDKDGAYRYGSGGKPLVVDKGDTLALKAKGPEAYRAAMELALAKGWTAIELKGKPAMLADAWLEAKLMNLDVVNYTPTEKDQEKYAARLAELKKEKEARRVNTVEQAPEMVEVRPFVDDQGLTQMATTTYTVSFVGSKDVCFGDAKDAAAAFFDGLNSGSSPVVIRSVTRADGIVQDAVVADFDIRTRKGANGRTLERLEDRDFNEALVEVAERMKAAKALEAEQAPVVEEGVYSGPILSVEGGMMTQKIDRAGTVIQHDISKLNGVVPKVGEMADIAYKKGVGYIRELETEQSLDAGGRDRGR